MIKQINPTTIVTTYNGATGCACGCGGNYNKNGTAVTRRVNKINNSLQTNWTDVQIFQGCENEIIYELVEGERVTRVYINA